MAKKFTPRRTAQPVKKASPGVSLNKQNETVRIEKISNGYLAVKEGTDKKGNWFVEKKFMDKNPLE